MKTKIGDVAIIFSGVYLTGERDADVLYLQVKDFNTHNEVLEDLEPMIKDNVKSRRHLLSDYDLLFAAKGITNFCTLYMEKVGKAVASSSFLVIKISNKDDILPEYVCWYLNQPRVLKLLKTNAVGSSIPSITKPMIENIEIEIPSIEQQQLIIRIARLQNKEQELLTAIAQLRRSLTETLLNNAIKKL